MEQILAVIVLILGAFGYYNFQKRKTAEISNIQAETKIKDASLVAKENQIKDDIKAVDAALDEASKKQPVDESTLTDEERANLWQKR